METTHGTWGNRVRTFEKDWGIVTILYLEPNQRCSWHLHKTGYNQFFCVKGEVGIKTDKGYTTRLREGQTFTVEPMVMHEFRTYSEPTIVEEIAFVKYDDHDIFRDKLGGPINE